MSIIGIILAAGRGRRMNSQEVNKVALSFSGRPMIQFGVELFQKTCDQIIVVVGAFEESVQEVLKDYQVSFVRQGEPNGTGHAVAVATAQISGDSPALALIGYGDHMMFYKEETINELIEAAKEENVALSMVTTTHQDPDGLGFARVLKNSKGQIARLIEQKDSTQEEQKITSLNAGLYCFNFSFLKENINKIKKSSVTGEYYLTDLIDVAIREGKTVAEVSVPFGEVGIGVNTNEQLEKSQDLYQATSLK